MTKSGKAMSAGYTIAIDAMGGDNAPDAIVAGAELALKRYPDIRYILVGGMRPGTFEQMFESLKKIQNLPKNTMMYCGHEYTKNNGQFCVSIDKDNSKLKDRIQYVKNRAKKNLPTLPVTLGEELETNIFLRCDDKKIKNNLKMDNSSKLEVFIKLRNLKDKF